MKLTLDVILLLHAALSDLNGFPKVVKEQVVVVPYKHSDELRKKISRNRRILTPFMEEYKDLRLAAIQEIADDGTAHIEPTDGPKQAAFAVRDREIRKSLQSVDGLQMLEYTELLVGSQNPIPATVLDDLAPLITGALPENTAPAKVEAEGGDPGEP